MKKILFFLTLMNLVQLGQSVTYLRESFLVDSSLNGQPPTIGGAWVSLAAPAGQMQVVGGRARFVGGATEDLASIWGGSVTGSLFMGFTLNVNTITNANTGDYFIMYRTGVTQTGRVHIFRSAIAPTNTFGLGISINNLSAETNWAVNLPMNQDIRVVTRIIDSGTNDSMTLWINPTNITDPSISRGPGAFISGISSIAVRQGAGHSGQFAVDDIIVDDSFQAALGRSVLLVDNTGNPLAANLIQGATNQTLYGFQVTAVNSNIIFNSVAITRTLGNGALSNDISNYRLYYDNDNNGFDNGDNLLATVATDSGTLNFNGITHINPVNSPQRYVVVADVAALAINGGTVGLQIANNTDFSADAGTVFPTTAPYPNAIVNHTVQDLIPTITTLTPLDGASNVSPTANLVIQFSENVTAGIGNIAIIETTETNSFETIPVTNANVTIMGNTVTIDPVGVLAFDTAYHVLIDAGAIEDVSGSGNSFAGINNPTTWNFQTIPTQLSINNAGNPLANNFNQGVTNQPLYGFQLTAANGDINFNAVNITRTLGNGAVLNNFSNYRLYYDSNTNGFDVWDILLATVPADNAVLNFAGIVGQTVQVGISRRYVVVADVANNAIGNGTISLQIANNADINTSADTITSSAPYPIIPIAHTTRDVIVPTTTSLTPPDGATDVATTANLVVQFNETVVAGSGNITIVETGVGNFETIPVTNANVTIMGNTITINPSGTLAFNTAYHVLIDSGAIEDLSGNDFAGINDATTWNFQTLLTQLSIDNTGNPVASNLNQGATNRPIYGFRLAATNGNVTFSSAVITRTLSNGALAGNVSNYRLFFDNDNNGFDAGDNLLVTVPADNVVLNFAGITGQTVTNGTSRRYVVVANVANDAVDEGTISLQIANNTDIGTSANTITSSAPYPIVPIVHTLQDITAPTIPSLTTALTPSDDATDVATTTDLMIQFNENVMAGVGDIRIETGVGNFETISVTNANVTIISNTVTINPVGTLAFNTAYHVLIDSGAFRDGSSNSFIGIDDATTWNFQTIARQLSIDNTGNPLANNFNQGLTNQPIYGFQLTTANGDINFNGVNITRTLGNGALPNNVSNYQLYHDSNTNGFDAGDTLLATVAADSAILNFSGITGQTVQVGTPRRYVVTGDIAMDAVGNGTIGLQIVSNVNVSTSADVIASSAPYPIFPMAHTLQDVTGPTIPSLTTSLTPSDNAINVATTTDLVIQFNEIVAAGVGNITIVETGISNNFETISTTNANVTIVGNIVTVNPVGILAFNTAYHVLIDSGAFRDGASNSFAGINDVTTWNFTTIAAANTSPTVEGAGLADVEVEENAPATIINLPPAFQDAETTDANLVYSVTATNFVDGDTEIFSNIAVDNAVDTLTLSYLPNSNGVYNVTVRATDAGGLFVEDTFQVTVLVGVTPAVDTNSITSLVVTPTNGVAFVGKTLQMTATGVATNGTTNVTLVSSWSSADTNIARVDNTGVVIGLTPGDVSITGVFNSLTNSVTVKVRKELSITFSKIKPAKRTPKLNVGKGFAVKGKFDTGTNLFTATDITSRPLKIQLAFLTSVTNTNGIVTSMTAFQDVTKIKGFKAIKPKSKGKFIAKAVGTDLAAGNATVLLQATLGSEGTNQEVSAIFTNPTSFQVRRK